MVSKVSYLYRNYPGTYRHGYLVIDALSLFVFINIPVFVVVVMPKYYIILQLLPPPFILDYGDALPKKVLMHIPNGDVWEGCYSKKRTCVKGLEDMMELYSVKPFYLVVIHYLGGREFDLEIFSPYAVEISYPHRRVTNDHEKVGNTGGKQLERVYDYVEVDKNCANLYFNAVNISQDEHEFVVEKQHLKKSEEYHVFGDVGCAKLGLDLSVHWIELCFRNYKWKVNLKWVDGSVTFDCSWENFANEGKLCEGDTCVVQRTEESQKYNVAVFEHNNIVNYNTAGFHKGKSLMKFFKIMNETMPQTCVLEFPKLFVDKYGKKIKEHVSLFTADGKKFTATYCSEKHLLTNLKDFVVNYKIKEKYIIFFDYVGNSSFYVSMFSPWCFDICNQIRKKFLLKHLIGEPLLVPKKEDVFIYDEGDGLGDRNLQISNVLQVDDNTENAVDMIKGEVAAAGHVYSFSKIIRKSHIDQKGHGMYIGKQMINVYRSWRKSTTAFLIYQGRKWVVAVLQNKRKCRFGIGWNNFTADNIFSIGRKLTFTYRGGKQFEVMYV